MWWRQETKCFSKTLDLQILKKAIFKTWTILDESILKEWERFQITYGQYGEGTQQVVLTANVYWSQQNLKLYSRPEPLQTLFFKKLKKACKMFREDTIQDINFLIRVNFKIMTKVYENLWIIYGGHPKKCHFNSLSVCWKPSEFEIQMLG